MSSPMDIDSEPPAHLPRNRRGQHEPVPDFLTRLPPSCTRTSTIGQWIYVSNPHCANIRDDVSSLKREGTRILHAFENEKARLTLEHDRSGSKSAVALSRKLAPLHQALEQSISSLARESGVVTGKWMLFITPDRVDWYWGVVATATVRGELGFGAKVAADDGEGNGGRSRLIAVYTRDYEDREDVKRVLRRMVELNLVRKGEKPIYYKCDALTHLDIMSNNPYGLKPTLFSTADVLAGKV